MYSRRRKLRGWCKRKFIWFHNETTPPSMAPKRKLNCVCCCKQLVHVLCLKKHSARFTPCYKYGFFLRSTQHANVRNGSEKPRKQAVGSASTSIFYFCCFKITVVFFMCWVEVRKKDWNCSSPTTLKKYVAFRVF